LVLRPSGIQGNLLEPYQPPPRPLNTTKRLATNFTNNPNLRESAFTAKTQRKARRELHEIRSIISLFRAIRTTTRRFFVSSRLCGETRLLRSGDSRFAFPAFSAHGRIFVSIARENVH